MKIQNETDILSQSFRKQVIDEINGPENLARKDELYRRFECYRDKTKNYVIEELKKQFDAETVAEMSYAIANVSVVKKIINKLARVYGSSITRKSDEYADQLYKYTNFNQKAKRLNRYLKLFRNTAMYVRPTTIDEKVQVQFVPLQPYLYDVIEHESDPTQAQVVILSTYNASQTSSYSGNAAKRDSSTSKPTASDGKDQAIADQDTGAQLNQYIWWSKSFHFTTDSKGEIISQGEAENPIKELPFVFLSEDTDNQFWSTSGGDLVQSAILINSMITNVNHIGITQGYGQFYMKGKNLPRVVKTGPNKAILMEYAEGEPTPDVGFASANPPLDQLMGLIEMQVALLLTTNNLSTSGVSLKLSGAQSAASGVALLIDKSESMEDVSDQQQIFIDAERDSIELAKKWIEYYANTGQLIEWQQSLKLPADYEPNTRFDQPATILSEKERLEIYKMRKDLGLDSVRDLIKKDNPSLTDEEIDEKLGNDKPEVKTEEVVTMTTPEVEDESSAEDDVEDQQESE